MPLDPHSPVPVYLQIAEHIRSGVVAGVYQPGEMIPSLRALALELVVNPNTVQRAYETLEREGLIEARKGLGMIVTVAGAAGARARSESAIQATFAQAIRAARGLAMPPNDIRDAFERALADGHAGAFRSQPDKPPAETGDTPPNTGISR